MIFVYFFIVIIMLIFYMSYETRLLAIGKVVLTESKSPLIVVHLSDIHIHMLFISPQRVLKAIDIINPDVLFLTGDYIEKPKDISNFLVFLKKIKGNRTVFMVFGNHDCDVFRENEFLYKKFVYDIESIGVTVLVNSSAIFIKGVKKYNIIGISDYTTKNHNIKKAYKSIIAGGTKNIALSHNPNVIFDLPQDKTNYLFSGHLHGGQIWAPFNFEAKILRKDKMSKMGINQGLHRFNGICLYINRGLGNVMLPLRFLSRPELTIYYLP